MQNAVDLRAAFENTKCEALSCGVVVVTFVPPLISLCSAFHAFYCVMKEAPEPDVEKAAKESAANPESSPTSPLARGAPPQEDEEQPAASNTD